MVKLVDDEPESVAMREWAADVRLVSSELVFTEVPRALLRKSGSRTRHDVAALHRQAMEMLDEVEVRSIDLRILASAGVIADPALRSLDAIHVASATTFRPLAAFVTYDKRQADAARLVGLPVVSPGA